MLGTVFIQAFALASSCDGRESHESNAMTFVDQQHDFWKIRRCSNVPARFDGRQYHVGCKLQIVIDAAGCCAHRVYLMMYNDVHGLL